MKIFDLKGVCDSLCTPIINSLLNSIEMYRGKTLAISNLKKLESLKAIARRSGTMASNSLGNVFISDEDEEALFNNSKAPESFQEMMIKGYVSALELIDQVYKFQPFDLAFVSTLHYYIYKDYNPEFGGKYKDTQNYIQESLPDGSYRTIFVPAAPEEVVPLLDNLIYQFNLCAADENINKLVLISAFMLEFMCIHPYNHGNGRVSRLLLNFLLKKYGYQIDDYFAIAYLMKNRIGDYIDALKASTDGWRDNTNNPSSYIVFFLKIFLEGYRKIDYILETNSIEGTADDKVYKVIYDSATPITKAVIQNVLYAASSATIEKALAKLLKDGKIQLINKGRYSKYFRV